MHETIKQTHWKKKKKMLQPIKQYSKHLCLFQYKIQLRILPYLLEFSLPNSDFFFFSAQFGFHKEQKSKENLKLKLKLKLKPPSTWSSPARCINLHFITKLYQQMTFSIMKITEMPLTDKTIEVNGLFT